MAYIFNVKKNTMSAEQATLVLEKFQDDSAFRDKILSIEDIKLRFDYMKSVGYDCSEADFSDLIININKSTAFDVQSSDCQCKRIVTRYTGCGHYR